MKNTISKIAMFTILMLNGTVKSQEFYTCIPNDDWVKGKAKEEITDTHIQNIVKQTILKSKWTEIIHLTPFSAQSEFKGTLPAGRYRVTAAGAGGPEQTREFTLTSSQEYKACAGVKGDDGGIVTSAGYAKAGGIGGRGMGYNGIYEGGKGGIKDERFSQGGDRGGYGSGYGVGYGGIGGSWGAGTQGGGVYASGGAGGSGCYGGGGGGGGGSPLNDKRFGGDGGGGGGGGSYFKVGNIEMVLKGGNGHGHVGAGPDGYVIIERWE